MALLPIEKGETMETNNKKESFIKRLAKKGFKAAVNAGHIAIYDKIFNRHDRPDYSVVPGIVCIDRLDKSIQREEISFYSNNALLKGNYFTCDNPKGLVLMAHGIHAGGDDYLNIVLYFLKNNFNVFSFNYQGIYESEGDSCVGFCQSLIDVNNAIEYISNSEKYNKFPLFLFGHSWGAYAVASVLSLQKNVKGCASIAGMNNGSTMMMDKAEQYVGDFADNSRPYIDAYQNQLFKDYVNYNAVKGINSINAPVIVAHGVDDKVIVIDKQAIMAHKYEITNDKVKFYVGRELHGGHNTIMYSNEAVIYQQQLKKELKSLEKSKERKLTHEELQEFYKNVDHVRYSEVNRELMDLIVSTFDSVL